MAEYIAIPGQSFSCQQDWVNRASRCLTSHPEFNDTERSNSSDGWQGYHFKALCFDQNGNRCRNGGDFQRAEDESAYPVFWVWPDQIAELIMQQHSEIERG